MTRLTERRCPEKLEVIRTSASRSGMPGQYACTSSESRKTSGNRAQEKILHRVASICARPSWKPSWLRTAIAPARRDPGGRDHGLEHTTRRLGCGSAGPLPLGRAALTALTVRTYRSAPFEQLGIAGGGALLPTAFRATCDAPNAFWRRWATETTLAVA